MHKISFIVFKLLFWLPFFALSQVGIGTVTPNAQLDIQSSNPSAPASNDGILIPKINEFPAIDPSAAQDGMMVYATGSGSVAKGFYYWNQSTTSWVTIVGSTGTIEKLDDLSDGKTLGSSIFIGTSAGFNEVSFNSNIGIGSQALFSNITGSYNIAFGTYSLTDNTSGIRNVAMGISTLANNTTGSHNTAIGSFTMFYNSTGMFNCAFGDGALLDNISGQRNTAIGFNAGGSSLGHRNVFLGFSAGYNELGSDKLYIESSTADQYNALIYGEFDNDLLRINGTLNINNQYSLPTADGALSQVLQTDGAGNMSWVDQNAAGAEEINDLSDGKTNASNNSIYLGANAGLATSNTNTGNVSMGRNTLSSLTIGDYNVSIGDLALQSITNGSSNIAIGLYAMSNRASGNDNVALGSHSQYFSSSGSENSSLGLRALYGNSGSYNTAIGAHAGHSSSTGSNNVFIGYRAGYFETGNNKLYIENTNANATGALIYGEFDTNLLRVNGTLDINNQYSFPTADGVSNQVLQTDGSGNLTWGNVLVSDATTASNGLTLTGSDVRLGGTLSLNSTLTHGTNNLTFNLNSTGDFLIQDNGVNHLELRDNGNLYLGGDTFWYDEDTSGTALASLGDLGDDGFFWLGNGGAPQHLLNGNGDSAFNVLGLAVDFSIQGDNNANLFYVDGGADRIGFRIGTPNYDIHLKQSGLTEAGAGGIALESSATTNNWKIYHSGSFLSFAENGVRRSYIQNGTGAYVQTSDRTLKKNITLYPEVLTSVLSLPIYSYHYRDQEEDAQKTIGVMAQDVQEVFPEIVSIAENGTLGLQYGGLGPIALKAIQEQQQLIDSQKTEIDLLKSKLENQQQEIEAIKAFLKKQ